MLTELASLAAMARNAANLVETVYSYREEIEDLKKRAEFQKCIAQLSIELSNTELELSRQVREATRKEERIAELEREIQALKTTSAVNLVKKEQFHYVEGEEDCPVCKNCYRNDGKIFNLSLKGAVYHCSSCGFQAHSGQASYIAFSSRSYPG
jgi:DNA repair exonuclease SbcCD ATPase subunit